MNKTRSREKFESLAPFLFLLISIVGFGLLLAWQHVQTLSTGYEINRLKKEKIELEERRSKLLLERASLLDYGSIEKVARKSMGFNEPDSHQILFFDLQKDTLVFWLPREPESTKVH